MVSNPVVNGRTVDQKKNREILQKVGRRSHVLSKRGQGDLTLFELLTDREVEVKEYRVHRSDGIVKRVDLQFHMFNPFNFNMDRRWVKMRFVETKDPNLE